MGRKLIGVVLLLVLGIAGIVGAYFLLPYFKDWQVKGTSDAGKVKGQVTIALDNWIGYFPLRSPEMKTAMRRAGWQLVIEDDKADYRSRMERLKKGEIDLAAATVDSYLLSGPAFEFPGTMIMVIDESKGGDSMVAKADVARNLSALRGRSDLRVAFTPGSPSHHLLKAAVDHFNLPELNPVGPGRIETNGSSEALQKLLTGKADLAVLWEPDVTRALAQPGVVKLLGTEDTRRLIVDVLLVSRKVSKEQPELIKLLMKTYFRTLKNYRDNPDLLKKHIREDTSLDDTAVTSMLKGVSWVSFGQNCEQWFDVAAPGTTAEQGLVDTVYSTASILVAAGDFSKSPVPGEDPYRLINSSFLEDLFAGGLASVGETATSGVGAAESLEARFSALDEAGWAGLKEVGALKVDPIIFQSSATELDLLAKQVVDKTVDRLKHYPNFRVVIKGHTGTRGDPAENQRLSQERAEAVAKYLEITYNVDPNRMRTLGLGGTQPLPAQPGESKRSHEYRLPRVELVLVREDF
jgi:outer membrane protein OmpA-like peptidoglycan-associated protein/ABC-type amino acid transport substrate-binding protein